MIHLTMNTGHSYIVPSGKVTSKALEYLSPIAKAGSGVILPSLPWQVFIEPEDGWAAFEVRLGSIQKVTLNVVAWTPAGADHAWPILERIHLDTSDRLATLGQLVPAMSALPKQPTSLPWLTTFIVPSAALSVRLEDMFFIADFEQSMAMAIIENFAGTTP